MKFLWFMLLFTVSAQAQNKLSAHTFQVNIKPVLSGIINDFYQMVVLFPDVPKDLIDIIQDVDRLAEQKDGLQRDCPGLIEKKCLPGIQALRKKIQSLDLKTIALFRKNQPSQSLHMTSLSGTRVVGDFQQSLEILTAKLDNLMFIIKAGSAVRQETSPLIKQVDELATLSSLALVEFIPFIYKEDFRHFYFSFVYPLQMQLEKPQNYQFLNRNLTSLNFALNLLNMNLTKRNKKTPEGMGPYLATIHNRWNSILRYYY